MQSRQNPSRQRSVSGDLVDREPTARHWVADCETLIGDREVGDAGLSDDRSRFALLFMWKVIVGFASGHWFWNSSCITTAQVPRKHPSIQKREGH
jgi:hypothetical protein